MRIGLKSGPQKDAEKKKAGNAGLSLFKSSPDGLCQGNSFS